MSDIDIRHFRSLRKLEAERSDGTPYTMGFVSFKEPDASLSEKTQMVTFDENLISMISNIEQGSPVEVE